MSRAIRMALLLLLTGCGAETAGTAAVQAALEAKEAEQGQHMLQAAREQLDAAQQRQNARLDELTKAAGN